MRTNSLTPAFLLFTIFIFSLEAASGEELLENTYKQKDHWKSQINNANTLKCFYEKGVDANWDHGDLTIEETGEVGPLVFDSINEETGRARLIGNIGAEDVTVISTPRQLIFIELTPTGNSNFTTVFYSADKDGRKFHSVHSRHIDLWPAPIPSQRYGFCKILD